MLSMSRPILVDLSHAVDGEGSQYPGLPPPVISAYRNREETAASYAAGVSFLLSRVEKWSRTRGPTWTARTIAMKQGRIWPACRWNKLPPSPLPGLVFRPTGGRELRAVLHATERVPVEYVHSFRRPR